MLTSRQRVMRAVNHEETDRVPIDLGGHRSSGIMAIAYHKLKQYLGIERGDIYVYDVVQQLAIIEPEVLDRFNVDTIELGRGFARRPEHWRDWVLPDGTPCKIPAFIQPIKHDQDWHIYGPEGELIAIQKAGSLYFEQTCFPLADYHGTDFAMLKSADPTVNPMAKVMWGTMGSPPAPLGYDEEGLRQLAAGAKALRASTDRAIIGLFGGNLMEWGQFIFGMANFLMRLAGDPIQIHHFLDTLTAVHLDNLQKFLSAVGPYIDIIMFGDDLGMQTGPQVSRRMFREFFYPRYKVMWEAAKQQADVKVMLHSCGSITSFMPDFIEAGLDIVQPVQTTAKDMDAELLKREFGQDICLWGGGCDTQTVLPRGTPAQVAEDVRRRVEILAPGGGFVFQQIHNIMADVPPENIVAMLDAVNA